MAKFVYKMQNILELQEKLEEQAKVDFRIANAALMEEQEKLRALMKRRADYQSQLKQSTSDIIDIKKVNFLKSAIEIIKTKTRDQMFELKKAESAVDAARERLNEVIKDRKTQEKLKEKAFEAFKQEVAASESKEIDQLVSFKYRP